MTTKYFLISNEVELESLTIHPELRENIIDLFAVTQNSFDKIIFELYATETKAKALLINLYGKANIEDILYICSEKTNGHIIPAWKIVNDELKEIPFEINNKQYILMSKANTAVGPKLASPFYFIGHPASKLRSGAYEKAAQEYLDTPMSEPRYPFEDAIDIYGFIFDEIGNRVI